VNPSPWPLVSKGVRLGQLQRSDDAIAVYDDDVRRLADDPDPDVRQWVAVAQDNKRISPRHAPAPRGTWRYPQEVKNQ
jgi:hypothetical protein